MPQEGAVQDLIDSVNNCCLAMWKEASLMDNDIVSIGDIAELEGKQDECEQNLRRAQEYVLQWQRSLAELKEIQIESSRRADVLQSWSHAACEQLPGLVTTSNCAAAPARHTESLLQQHHLQRLGIDSPRRGVGARTISLHSSASGPSENPQVLRDVINSAAAAATNVDQQGSQGKDTVHSAVSKKAPRPFVTKSELDQCSSYLVGRWTQSKINAAIEELAGFAEHNANQIAALKSKVSTFKSSETRKRMLDLAAVAKANPRMQKHFWFLESDLKDGTILRCDRSGKGLLQLLRHLKRFSEVRCKVRNEADIVYIYESTG